MRQRVQLEIAVTGPQGVVAARLGGADRVELCSALELGGVTPSQGVTEASLAANADELPVHALIRCRPGGFVYTDEESDTMVREVRALARCGVAGVVIGGLSADGHVAREFTRRLADEAHSVNPSITVTFHRAIDQTSDPVRELNALAEAGVERVLSSGGCASAAEGLSVLSRMALSTTVDITAGGGVHVANISALARTGVSAIHLSAKHPAKNENTPGGKAWVSLGAADDNGAVHFVTDTAIVAAAAAALRLPDHQNNDQHE